MKLDIFFRAHTVVPEKKRKNGLNPPKWSDYVLVFDTETTTDTFSIPHVRRIPLLPRSF